MQLCISDVAPGIVSQSEPVLLRDTASLSGQESLHSAFSPVAGAAACSFAAAGCLGDASVDQDAVRWSPTATLNVIV
jgi:hypothetical protein